MSEVAGEGPTGRLGSAEGGGTLMIFQPIFNHVKPPKGVAVARPDTKTSLPRRAIDRTVVFSHWSSICPAKRQNTFRGFKDDPMTSPSRA